MAKNLLNDILNLPNVKLLTDYWMIWTVLAIALLVISHFSGKKK